MRWVAVPQGTVRLRLAFDADWRYEQQLAAQTLAADDVAVIDRAPRRDACSVAGGQVGGGAARLLGRRPDRGTAVADSYRGKLWSGHGRETGAGPFPNRARDGLEISALLTLPVGAGRFPSSSCRMAARSIGTARASIGWCSFLASRGYGVLQPQFRGSAVWFGFPAAGYWQWGQGMQADISDGDPLADRNQNGRSGRIAIVGMSYGGYIALLGLVRDEALYRCAGAFAPVTDVVRPVARRASGPRPLDDFLKTNLSAVGG